MLPVTGPSNMFTYVFADAGPNSVRSEKFPCNPRDSRVGTFDVPTPLRTSSGRRPEERALGQVSASTCHPVTQSVGDLFHDLKARPAVRLRSWSKAGCAALVLERGRLCGLPAPGPHQARRSPEAGLQFGRARTRPAPPRGSRIKKNQTFPIKKDQSFWRSVFAFYSCFMCSQSHQGRSIFS